MRTSWCLPPLAALFLGGALWIAFSGPRFEPAELCASARARLAALPSDSKAASRARGVARRELDGALRRTLAPEQASLRAELLGLRAALNEKEGLDALALEDCRARLELGARDADTLARICALLLRGGEPGQALAFAAELVTLDPARGHAFLGGAHVDLSATPLGAIERQARGSLSPARAVLAGVLARRAAALSGEENLVAPAREELLELFTRSDERRLAGEWLRDAGLELGAARADFLASLEHGTTSLAVAGLQDLCLRAGLEDEAAELGTLALAQPQLPDPMRLLVRTAQALVALGREPAAIELVRAVQRRLKGKLEPEELPSDGPRDELTEWCALLAGLEIWGELGQAAWVLLGRGGDDPQQADRARIFAATAALRARDLGPVRVLLDALGSSTLVEPEATIDLWLLRGELARQQEKRSEERFALLTLLRLAPLDPPEPLRGKLGRAWERLAALQLEDGEILAASDSLTHALRCSRDRKPALVARWHEVGKQAAAMSGGLPNSYSLYQRALWSLEGGKFEAAAEDARALLETNPGLGPALEIASAAAQELRSYPLMIEASLELLARGWPPEKASARLRAAPAQYFLPQDRVRWLELDPRGSLEAVVRRLLARGDEAGAARAARSAPLTVLPEEILPLLARTLLATGDPAAARETLAALPAESAPLRGSTGLALELAARDALGEEGRAGLGATLTRVLASGRPEDPELVGALAGLISAGLAQEAAELASWMMDERTPFLAEALLARAALDALGGGTTSESLERAESLVEDGRTELGRLILAAGDGGALAAEARAALATPLAADAGRELALLLLAGESGRAAQRLAGMRRDGRATSLELAAACAVPGADTDDPGVWLVAPGALSGSLKPERFLLLVLAAELPPWSAWVLQSSADLPPAAAADPHLRAVRVLAALALGRSAAAERELAGAEEGTDARLAWLRARWLRASRAEEKVCVEAELAWLERSGRAEEGSAELANLRAERAERRGDVVEAVRILERARGATAGGGAAEGNAAEGNAAEGTAADAASPDRSGTDAALLEHLARLENTPGRRVRAFELYAELLATAPPESGDPRVLACLDVLRTARDEGELSELRWWAEVEALEAERPLDPAPARELATRAFEQPGALGEHGRAHALARLERFRARTLERPVESLRTGEALRWTRLLARFTPEGAVEFAEQELRRDPADPWLWRASAEALVAAGRTRAAIERLEAISRVAPGTETTRLLLQLRYGLDRDAASFHRQLMLLRRLDPRAKDDVVLAYLACVADPDVKAGLKNALELWAERDTNALASPDFGRPLALALHAKGLPEAAVQVLREAGALARSTLERDVLAVLARLIESAPRPAAAAAAPDAPAPPVAPDDAPAATRPEVERAAGEGAPAPGRERKRPKERAPR